MKAKNIISIFFLFIIIIYAIPIIIFKIINSSLLLSKTSITSMVTIDSLITSTTIAFLAFTNYAASSSGSSQVLRKISWENLQYSDSDSKTIKWTKKIMSPLFINTHLLIVTTIVLSMLDAFILPFAKTNISNLYLIINVIISSIILISIITKYYIFHINLYENGAKLIVTKITSKNSSKEIRRAIRTYLNPLNNTKNDTLIRSILRNVDKNKNNNEVYIFLNIYLEQKWLVHSNWNWERKFSLFLTFKHHDKLIKLDEYENIIKQFRNLLSVRNIKNNEGKVKTENEEKVKTEMCECLILFHNGLIENYHNKN